MDFDFFEQSLLSSSLFTDPDNTVDAFVDQLHNVVTSTPDKLAPLRTVDRISGGSHINQFLSQKVTYAKRYRRRLERNWKKTGAEADRLAYRQQCKLANNLIIGSRKDHFAKRLADVNAGSKQRWSAVKELLHSRDQSSLPQLSEMKQLCNTISSFFNNKFHRMKDTIASRLPDVNYNPFICDGVHHGPQLTEFTPVTVEEVMKRLNTMPAISLPMDLVLTSVMKRCKGVFAPDCKTHQYVLQSGPFPDTQFKLAQVSPILKKAEMDVNDTASFKPISNLNTISKIIERLALSRLRSEITKSSNFNKLQSAYR